MNLMQKIMIFISLLSFSMSVNAAENNINKQTKTTQQEQKKEIKKITEIMDMLDVLELLDDIDLLKDMSLIGGGGNNESDN